MRNLVPVPFRSWGAVKIRPPWPWVGRSRLRPEPLSAHVLLVKEPREGSCEHADLNSAFAGPSFLGVVSWAREHGFSKMIK